MATRTGYARLRLAFFTCLVGLSLFSITRAFIEVPSDVNRNAIAVVKWEERFVYARQLIQIERGTVGYISEWDIPGREYDQWDQEIELLLTQYSLAPLV